MSGQTPPLDGSRSDASFRLNEGFQEDRSFINGGTSEKVAGFFHNDQGKEYIGTLPYRLQKEQFPIDFDATKKLPKEMKETAHDIVQAAKLAMRHLPPSPAAPAA